MNCDNNCWWQVLCSLAWLLITSGLLVLTWNKVIVAQSKAKQVKYWQGVLFLLTICALCSPHHHRHRWDHCSQGACDHSSCNRGDCAGKEKCKEGKGDCEYSKKHRQSQQDSKAE